MFFATERGHKKKCNSLIYLPQSTTGSRHLKALVRSYGLFTASWLTPQSASVDTARSLFLAGNRGLYRQHGQQAGCCLVVCPVLHGRRLGNCARLSKGAATQDCRQDRQRYGVWWVVGMLCLALSVVDPCDRILV